MSELLKRMQHDILLPEDKLRYLIKTAPRRYKVYSVEKKSGVGHRTICQPAREVKRLQYWLIDSVLSHLPVHFSATAYEKGCSIRKNAYQHLQSRFLLKTDFAEFFPSFRPEDFDHYLDRAEVLEDPEDRWVLSRVLFWKAKGEELLRLAIGAPSSPRLSNVLMCPLDETINAYCEQHSVVYTRYADDMTFSALEPDVLRGVIDQLRALLQKCDSPKLQLNEGKTRFLSRKGSRNVTGLVLANQGYISLGRTRKRVLRAMVHRYSLGVANIDVPKLRGHLSFAHSVEPEFTQNLLRQFNAQDLLVL